MGWRDDRGTATDSRTLALSSVFSPGPRASTPSLVEAPVTLSPGYGTPRYMAPEQFRAEPADARTDQFSFCVALHEALYGHRPLAGDTLPVLMTSVVTGHVSPPPRNTRVPRWLRRVLLRGLETERERRFPSMAALVAALDGDGASSLRRAAARVAGILAAALRVAARGGALELEARRAEPRPSG